MEGKLFRLPLSLRLLTWVTIGVWLVVALFPLLWLLIMSFKLPLDAFDADFWNVVFGPITRERVGGVSLLSALLAAALTYLFLSIFAARDGWLERFGLAEANTKSLVIVGFYLVFLLAAAVSFVFVLPLASRVLNGALSSVPFLSTLAKPLFGLTTQNYQAVWVQNGFYKQFLNTLYVTVGVVTLSLTIGTLAAYGLARTRTPWAFWILIAALIFRALPHSTLVTGYLPLFIDWGLYGKRIAVVVVLVAINQPFTIWMLRSFFMNIPAALDEAALVDGCNHLQAFWNVIMPVMWPGVITTGLFSFMLAYNDYLVSALLLDGETRTMVPAILAYFNRETTLTDQLEAIAAAASITFPLFLLVLFFQKQIVSGLTQGAVKG